MGHDSVPSEHLESSKLVVVKVSSSWKCKIASFSWSICNEIEELTTGRWCLIGYIRVRFIAREMR